MIFCIQGPHHSWKAPRLNFEVPCLSIERFVLYSYLLAIYNLRIRVCILDLLPERLVPLQPLQPLHGKAGATPLSHSCDLEASLLSACLSLCTLWCCLIKTEPFISANPFPTLLPFFLSSQHLDISPIVQKNTKLPIPAHCSMIIDHIDLEISSLYSTDPSSQPSAVNSRWSLFV